MSHIDLFPTLCDLVDGVDQPNWLQGRSLMPHVRDRGEGEVNEEVFAEVSYHAAYEPQRAVRTRRWKYIKRFVEDDKSTPVLPNCDDSPSKEVWLEHGWRERRLDVEQLYDLVFDPNETDNLAGKPEASTVLEEMRQRLQRWMTTTDDPLLKGPVPAPPGARINDADGMSPRDTPRVT